MRGLAVLLALIAALFSAPAWAWGEFGHHTVAAIAMRNIQPQTAARVRTLLRAEAGLGTPECRVTALEQAAYWPDCIRRDRLRWAFTFPWHYQTAPICKPFDPRANCANGNCVSGQIERSSRILADRRLPRAQRLEALAWLAHLVGDIHMPLHFGDNEDQGGNAIAARYGIAPGRNLHAVWDGPLAERAITSALPVLVREYSPREVALYADGTIADWGAESWKLAREFIYRRVADADPCASANPPAIIWADTDIEESLPELQNRITRAGLRLARLLDEALAR